jgi:hypothetical protein
MQDNVTKLRSAVGEVEKLEQERQKIIAECAAKTDVSRFTEATRVAQKRFNETGTIEDESALIVAQLVEQEASRRVRGMAFAKASGYLIGMEWNEFNRRFPGWRTSLQKVCEVKLDLVRESLEEISVIVRQQLGREFDVEDDQRVKRARREVETWQGAIERCTNTSDADAERFYRGIINRIISSGDT